MAFLAGKSVQREFCCGWICGTSSGWVWSLGTYLLKKVMKQSMKVGMLVSKLSAARIFLPSDFVCIYRVKNKVRQDGAVELSQFTAYIIKNIRNCITIKLCRIIYILF